MRLIKFIVLVLATSDHTKAAPGLLIPLYSYPTQDGGPIWKAVRQSAADNPSVPFVAIVNPNSGPGSSADSVYASAIDSLVNVGVKCIGYVRTDYSKVALSTVTENMDRYKSWYPQISGYFLDEMAKDGGHETYYTNLTSHAISLGNQYSYTVGNPGTSTTQAYFKTVNNTVIYETNFLPKPSVLDLGFPAMGSSMIAYNVPRSNLNQSYIDEITHYVSLVYITDDILDNPYDTLPTYFSQLVCYLSVAGSQSDASC